MFAGISLEKFKISTTEICLKIVQFKVSTTEMCLKIPYLKSQPLKG